MKPNQWMHYPQTLRQTIATIMILVWAFCLSGLFVGCARPTGETWPTDQMDGHLETSLSETLVQEVNHSESTIPVLTAGKTQPEASTEPTENDLEPTMIMPMPKQTTASPPTSSAGEVNRAALPSGISLLAGLDLDQCCKELQKKTSLFGFAAAKVQPDENRPDIFLVVAENEASAHVLNGFFYWLADPATAQSEQQLILGLDRLFTDAGRDTALAGGFYRDPIVAGLLDRSLQLVLREQYQPAIQAFILDCYGQDFQDRLEKQTPVAWTKRKIFQNLEVIYEASIYSTVSFKILSV